MAQYKVLRPHHGDKEYSAGDMREADPAVVAHLVKLGCLEPVSDAPTEAVEPGEPGEKAAAKPKNKAAASVENKAD